MFILKYTAELKDLKAYSSMILLIRFIFMPVTRRNSAFILILFQLGTQGIYECFPLNYNTILLYSDVEFADLYQLLMSCASPGCFWYPIYILLWVFQCSANVAQTLSEDMIYPRLLLYFLICRWRLLLCKLCIRYSIWY